MREGKITIWVKEDVDGGYQYKSDVNSCGDLTMIALANAIVDLENELPEEKREKFRCEFMVLLNHFRAEVMSNED